MPQTVVCTTLELKDIQDAIIAKAREHAGVPDGPAKLEFQYEPGKSEKPITERVIKAASVEFQYSGKRK